MWHNLSRVLAAILPLLLGVALLHGQSAGTDTASADPNTQSPSKAQFFSGTVTTLDKEHITVSRVLVGKPPETRTFAIKPTTKVAKSVKAKIKVTVRYQHDEDDGDVALEIQLRSAWRFPKAS
ncbi:MAG: hypothetical protein JWP08_4321 [Bryobacterales bacterium]|jgi:hypothetical protein|nr:hypothetical protein [Bryobacterales bacterium]